MWVWSTRVDTVYFSPVRVVDSVGPYKSLNQSTEINSQLYKH